MSYVTLEINQNKQVKMANGHGGPRPNSGRKPGYREALHSLPDATALLARGITPIEVLLISMRRSWDRVCVLQESIDNQAVAKADELKQLDEAYAMAVSIAKDAAPYCHPKLSATKVEGADNENVNGGVVLQLAPGDQDL